MEDLTIVIENEYLLLDQVPIVLERNIIPLIPVTTFDSTKGDPPKAWKIRVKVTDLDLRTRLLALNNKQWFKYQFSVSNNVREVWGKPPEIDPDDSSYMFVELRTQQ